MYERRLLLQCLHAVNGQVDDRDSVADSVRQKVVMCTRVPEEPASNTTTKPRGERRRRPRLLQRETGRHLHLRGRMLRRSESIPYSSVSEPGHEIYTLFAYALIKACRINSAD